MNTTSRNRHTQEHEPRSNKKRSRDKKKQAEEEADDKEADFTTTHADVAYWYSSYEDPNCLAVVELVATETDKKRGIEVRFARYQ